MGTVSDPLVPTKECGTPESQYSFRCDGRNARFGVYLPKAMIKDSEQKAFFDAMHAAMLPVVEDLYRKNWKRCFAGTVDSEGRPYPDEYEGLWLKDDPDHAG